MSGKPKRYTPEFKEQAARQVVENSRPIAHVARELGINDTTLGFWVKAYRKKLAGQPLPPDMPDQERIRELERRNRELEMENEFLKKRQRTSRGSIGEGEVRVHRCAVR